MTAPVDVYETRVFWPKQVWPWSVSGPEVEVEHKPTGMLAWCAATPSELLNRSRAIAVLARLADGRAQAHMQDGELRIDIPGMGIDLRHQLAGVLVSIPEIESGTP